MGGRREEFRIHAFIIYSSDVLFSLPAHINITEAEIRHNINIYTNRNQGMWQSRKNMLSQGVDPICWWPKAKRLPHYTENYQASITAELIEFVMILSLNDEYRSDISSHGCLRPTEQLYVLKKWKDFESCQIDDKDLVIKKSPRSLVPGEQNKLFGI